MNNEALDKELTTVGELIKKLQTLSANEKIVSFRIEFAYRPFGLCILEKNDDE